MNHKILFLIILSYFLFIRNKKIFVYFYFCIKIFLFLPLVYTKLSAEYTLLKTTSKIYKKIKRHIYSIYVIICEYII